MKKQKWPCLIVAITLFFGGFFLGCGTNDKPAQQKQDSLPMDVTDTISEEPATVQDSEADAAPANPASDFEYTKSDVEVTITKLKKKQMESDIVIPRTIDGLPVTTIGEDAFSGCRGLTSLTLSESVTSIEKNAFLGCYNLTIRTSKGSAAEKYAIREGIKIETTASSSR